MKIKYYIKNVFGQDQMYINDEATRQTIQQLTGKKTINKSDIVALKKLGHNVEHEPLL